MTYFSSFPTCSPPASTPDSSQYQSSIYPPRNQVAFLSQSRSALNTQLAALAIRSFEKGRKLPDKRQTNDQTISLAAVRCQSVSFALSALQVMLQGRGFFLQQQAPMLSSYPDWLLQIDEFRMIILAIHHHFFNPLSRATKS